MLKRLRILLGDEVYEVEIEVEDPRLTVEEVRRLLGARAEAARPMPKIRGLAVYRVSSANEVRAPMPGRVLSVKVGPGAYVRKGDVVVLLEAMKTQVEIKSHIEGRVKEVRVKEGDSVRQNDVLLVIEPGRANP